MPFAKPNLKKWSFSKVEIRMIVVLTVGILNHFFVCQKRFERLYFIIRVAMATRHILFQRSFKLSASLDGPVCESLSPMPHGVAHPSALYMGMGLISFARLGEYISACYLRQTVVIDSESEWSNSAARIIAADTPTRFHPSCCGLFAILFQPCCSAPYQRDHEHCRRSC